MQVKTGVISTPSSNGAVSVTGVGFTPKLVIFFGNGSKSLDTLENIFLWSMGAADGTSQWSTYLYQQHESGFSGYEFNATQCIKGSTGAVSYYATLASFDSDGFTLNWFVAGTAPGGYVISYVALGDIEAKVGTLYSNTPTGLKSITGLPFQPKCVMLGVAGVKNATGWRNGHFSVFAEDGVGWSQDHGLNTNSPTHYYTMYTEGVTAFNISANTQYATWSSLNSDGFTVNVTTLGLAYTFGYIAIGGDNFHAWSKMESVDYATYSGVYSKSGLAFEPQFAMAVDQCGITGVTTFRMSSSWTDTLSTYGSSYYIMSPDDYHKHTYTQLLTAGAALEAENASSALTYFSALNNDGFDWTFSGFPVASNVGFLVLGEEAKTGGLSALGVG